VARPLLNRTAMTRWLVLVVIAVNSAACTIYWGDDDCDYEAYPTDVAGTVDPYTNQCVFYGGGGGSCGDDGWGGAAEPAPNGAVCPGACDALAERDCAATAGCRTTYTSEWCDPSTDGPCPDQAFNHCWGVHPYGVVAGECWGLDAYSCASRDDCSAVYSFGYYAADAEAGAPAPTMTFQRCQPEWEPPGGCDAITCEPGTHCVEECYPCDDADGDGVCPPYCDAYCVPDATCDGVTCPLDTHCELQCTTPDPSTGTTTCDPVCMPDYACEVVDCPPGQHCEETCVVVDCLPDTECPPPVCTVDCVPDGPTCEMIGTEAECNARPDCTSVYNGFNCTCNADGTCTCETLVWDRCET
jgi:hypothetical protein